MAGSYFVIDEMLAARDMGQCITLLGMTPLLELHGASAEDLADARARTLSCSQNGACWLMSHVHFIMSIPLMARLLVPRLRLRRLDEFPQSWAPTDLTLASGVCIVWQKPWTRFSEEQWGSLRRRSLSIHKPESPVLHFTTYIRRGFSSGACKKWEREREEREWCHVGRRDSHLYIPISLTKVTFVTDTIISTSPTKGTYISANIIQLK